MMNLELREKQMNEFDDEKNDELKIDEKTLKRYFVHARLNKTCDCKNKQILIDIANRELECSICGAKLDPFDVVVQLNRQEDRYWNIMKALRQQCEDLEKWMLNNRMGKKLRDFASNLRQGLIPKCPHCNKPFDLANLTHWCSKEYAIALNNKKSLQKRNEELMNEIKFGG